MSPKKFRFAFALAVVSALQVVGTNAIAASESDPMMEALLRPTGWRADWSGPGGSGYTEIVFERQAEKVVAKIRLISPFEMTCENPVIIGPKTVTFDGCRDPALTLHFEATNSDIPFRGRTPRGYEWKLKPK